MSNPLSVWLRGLSFALLLITIAAPVAAHAKVPSSFRGKYTGVLVLAQADGRVVGNANVKVRGGKFVITGAINNVAFRQDISLAPNGGASVSTGLPGIAAYNQRINGTYSGKKRLNISAALPAPRSGTFRMQIQKTTYGSTLSISTVIVNAGEPPIYVTVVAT